MTCVVSIEIHETPSFTVRTPMSQHFEKDVLLRLRVDDDEIKELHDFEAIVPSKFNWNRRVPTTEWECLNAECQVGSTTLEEAYRGSKIPDASRNSNCPRCQKPLKWLGFRDIYLLYKIRKKSKVDIRMQSIIDAVIHINNRPHSRTIRMPGEVEALYSFQPGIADSQAIPIFNVLIDIDAPLNNEARITSWRCLKGGCPADVMTLEEHGSSICCDETVCRCLRCETPLQFTGYRKRVDLFRIR